MIRLRLPLLAAALAAAAPAPAAAATYATPEIAEIVKLDMPGGVAFAMRGRLGNTGTYVGLSLLCAPGPDRRVEVTAYFGGFPADARPVQLAIRDSSGRVHRFGPVVRLGPAHGFHSPRLTEPSRALRFLDAALRPDSLVSNGYRSFRNRASPADNERVRSAFARCLRELRP